MTILKKFKYVDWYNCAVEDIYINVNQILSVQPAVKKVDPPVTMSELEKKSFKDPTNSVINIRGLSYRVVETIEEITRIVNGEDVG